MMKVIGIMLLGAIFSVTVATAAAVTFSERVTVNPALIPYEMVEGVEMGDYQ